MNKPMKPIKTKEMFARDLKISNVNLLMMILCSLVNIVMIIANADTSFPFSASVPMYLTMLFSELCGMRSDEFYELNYGADWKSYEFMSSGVFWGVVAFSVIIVGVYALLWYFSKKKKVFTTILTVLYAIDSFALLGFNTVVYAFNGSAIIEFAFHAWVFYYLILALKAWDGIAYAPSEAELAAQTAPVQPAPAFDEAAFEVAQEESVTVNEDAE